MVPGNAFPNSKHGRDHKSRCKHDDHTQSVGEQSHTALAVSAKGWHVAIDIMGTKQNFMLDSGSDVTIVPYKTILCNICNIMVSQMYTFGHSGCCVRTQFMQILRF